MFRPIATSSIRVGKEKEGAKSCKNVDSIDNFHFHPVHFVLYPVHAFDVTFSMVSKRLARYVQLPQKIIRILFPQ